MLIRQENQRNAILVTIWSFLDKGFKYYPDICNGCHDLLMMSVNLGNIAISNIKRSDYLCSIRGISKSWGNKLDEKYWLDWKMWNIIKHSNLLSHKKLSRKTLTFGDIEISKKNYCHKSPIFLEDLSTERSNKISSS